jgi:hypothetical protein
MVSDLTGTEGPEEDFVTLTIREHPAITEPKALDVLPDEIKDMKSAGELVVLEIGNGEKKQMIVTLAVFRKLCSDEIVKNARGTKGRRPGYSPNAR